MRSLRLSVAAVSGVVFTIIAAACGQDLTTQPASALRPPLPPTFDAAPTLSSVTNLAIPFVIKPYDDNRIWLGPHYLVIPANSVCDPATSGYGDTMWNRPCDTIKRSITVIATVTTKNGHPLVEFDTHLRFKPTPDNSAAVMLYLRDPNANSASKITWCPTIVSAVCIDESASASNAPQLKTWFDNSSFWVYRRIQHFSGYNVTGSRDDGSDSTSGQ